MSGNATTRLIYSTLLQLYLLARGKFSAANVGRLMLDFVEATGGIVRLLVEGMLGLLRPPYRVRLVLSQAVVAGWSTVPLIIISQGFLGAITVMELEFQLERLIHNTQLVPGIAALLSFREYGPSVVAAMVACKVGAGFTAEIGGMKTTDQLDALELMGVNLVHYLVAPRLAACVMMQVCLSIVGVFCAFMAGFLVNIFTSNFQMYLGTATDYVGWADFINLMFKSLALSWIVPVVSCYYGMKAVGGAQGVGEATTKAVVIEILMIIIGDFTISAVADRLISAVI